ncbi:MAG: hypothetical protein E5W70_24775 [Mesorhizobium sp.]|uniref:hypothetical protein n=1 Tax=Mesorhizobium sp. TaxID=1871066 RepID=UPI0011FE47C9|nr:hypothetical protein [Mesorhizobium sp.]TIT19580.1 MAG: hypothetical protein E5W70_24775 [Mesorhizobium sp.]
MTTKLHINISQGVIDIEGDPDLVREIYTDFKGQLLNGVKFASPTPAPAPAESPAGTADDDTLAKPRTKRQPSSKKKASGGDDAGSGVVANSPKLDKNLDTSTLPAFYGQYELKNNAEKILVFLKFMNDKLGIEGPNTDQFYTCYEKADERVPKVFSQAFRDASGRKFGFIDYNSPTDIRVTTVGNNHFKFDLKKKGGE